MQENNLNQENQSSGNKQKRNIIIGVIATVIILLTAGFLYMSKKQKPDAGDNDIKVDSTYVTVKADSAKVAPNEEYDDEEGYEPYSENFVVANEAYLRAEPSNAETTIIKTMRFGNRLYVDNDGSENSGFAKVYLDKPVGNKTSGQAFYITRSAIVEQYQFEEFRKYFSLSPFSELASKTKKLILDEDYSNGTQYEVTQNADRAKYTLTYGDFDKDGVPDVAIVLDNNEKQISRLLIICTNNTTKEPYLAFAENYSDKVKISSFKKGASVIMNSEDLIPSPNDGVIIQGEDIKLAIIYDNSLQKFKTYYQE